MLKSKHILSCRKWLRLLGTTAVNTIILLGAFIAKSQDDIMARQHMDMLYTNLPQKETNNEKVANTSPIIGNSQDVDPALSDNEGPESTDSDNPMQSIIQYNAEDVIVFNVKDRTIHLHDSGVIKYDTIKLEAEEVFLDLTHNTIAAFSKKNAMGEVEKKAVLTKDNVEYIAESVHYNFTSQRAIANKLFTKQEDGFLRANKIRKDRATTFYADQATYTTCNLRNPHFHVDVRQIKIIEDDKIASGPFKLYFDGVPTPFGLPFGIFYIPRGSGVIPPKYGGESKKGFCLENGGYYINFNDYADLALQGSIYSKGATQFKATSRYKKRYRYSGDLFYQRDINLPTQEYEPFFKIKTWELIWKHGTENNRKSSLNADVHLKSTPTSGGILEEASNAKGSISSSIRYTNSLVGLPYTLSVSLQHDHNFQTQKADASIPNTTFRTRNIYPFRKRGRTTGNWYSSIYLQHTIKSENRLSNEIGNEKLDFLKMKHWPKLWQNGKQGIQQTLPIQTNIKCLHYFNLTPKFEWRERWYWEKINYRYDTEAKNITEEQVRGFVRVYDYDISATLKTTVYGTHFFGHNATVQALRHVFEPVVSFTHTPDFSGPEHGYWQTIKGGEKDGEKFNRFKKAIYGAPGNKATTVLKIDLNNRLDMKVKSNAGAKEKTRKISILESFDWSTSYDFQKEKHHWDDIQFKTRTSLFNKLFNFSFKIIFDPYLYQSTPCANKDSKRTYIKSDELAWRYGKGLGNMKNASLSIGAKLSSKAKHHPPKSSDQADGHDMLKKGKGRSQIDPEKYVDFTIPWNLDLTYNWTYTRAKPGNDPQKTNSLGFEWRVLLTEKWQIICKSAYDFTKREWVGNATDIAIHRDLHCWEMDFNWNPLGDKQTYKFSVGLKVPFLRDFKYKRDNKYTKY